MKYPKKCSYTILESPCKNKWGVMAKVWENIILPRIEMCLG
jgi:hypothetical protein